MTYVLIGLSFLITVLACGWLYRRVTWHVETPMAELKISAWGGPVDRRGAR